MTSILACELCKNTSDASTVSAINGLIYRNEKLYVVLVDDPGYPGFCRVIWNAHVKEMTDLDPIDRALFMGIVWDVEAVIREVMLPEKINLASLGNIVPHLHWHVIPRYRDDAHFPSPVWAEVKREPAGLPSRVALLPRLSRAIVERINQRCGTSA